MLCKLVLNLFWTRLALASVLGSFGVHLLKFTLPWVFRLEFVTHNNTYETYLIFPMIAISENTWCSDYFWYSFGLKVFQSKRKMIEPSLTTFIGFPFALVFTCTFTECVTYITSTWAHEFWKTSGYSLKCVLKLVASTSHAKVPSEAPHSTGFSRTSSKTLVDLLSYYRAANSIKPLVARSTNSIVIQVYLWIKSSTSSHHNFEINLM